MAIRDAVDVVAREAIGRATSWRRAVLTLAQPDSPPRCQPLPVKRIAMQAVGIWLVTRLALVAITVLARAYGFGLAAPTAASVSAADPHNGALLLPLVAAHPLLANWVHWDGSWYLFIALHGYDVLPAVSSDFFPLYPLAIHLVTLVLGPQAVLPVGLALSNLAALAAFIGLGLLAAHEASGTDSTAEAPARLMMVTAAYPFAFFLFATYSEAFFLAFVVFCLLGARRGWWGWAAVCALLAGLTRPTALALVPALAWEYGRQHGLWQRIPWRQAVRRSLRRLRTLAGGLAVVAAMPLGLAGYLVFLKLRYGDFLLPFKAHELYHGHVTWPVWQTLAVMFQRFFSPHLLNPPDARLYLDGGIVILFLVITLLNLHRLPLLYSLYMLATIVLVLTAPIPHRTEVIPSAGRYMVAAVPVFLLLSRWMPKRPWLEALVIGGGFMLQALFVVIFLSGAWIE